MFAVLGYRFLMSGIPEFDSSGDVLSLEFWRDYVLTIQERRYLVHFTDEAWGIFFYVGYFP